jgi:pyruvate dehydrogenase E1 component beta subunit
MAQLSYCEAIVSAMDNALSLDRTVVYAGQLLDYKGAIFNSAAGLADKHGPDRVMDYPNSESVMTGMAIGAAAAGMRPVLVHPRIDFMMYSMDAIVNWMALWRFKSNGVCRLPVTIRAVVGKGWGQGPQHSKSMHSMFAHLPGIRVAVPSTARDVKGLLLENIFGENPGIIIEGRALYDMRDEVPETPYRTRFGKARVRKKGSDITVVAIGLMVPLALKAAEILDREGVSAEVIDPVTISPLDSGAILDSVRKTGRLLAADPDWEFCGAAAEIIAGVCEKCEKPLRAPPARLCHPQSHTPMSAALERAYYPDIERFASKIRSLVSWKP